MKTRCRKAPRFESLFFYRMGLDFHNLALVQGDALGQNIHGPLQIRLIQNIGNPHLVDTLTGGLVEGRSWSKHHGVTAVGELLQQPVLELVRIITGRLAIT